MSKLLIFSWLYLLSIPLFAQDLKVAQLDGEYRNNPIGIDVQSPGLSWEIQSSKLDASSHFEELVPTFRGSNPNAEEKHTYSSEIASYHAMRISRVYAVPEPRARISFNKDWKFFLGDEPDAKSSSFSDLKWRKLTLPHDWSIEGKFDEKNPAKPEGGGLPTGIGWYRKEFTAPANFKNRLITLEFDGVYKNSEVWVNGQYLGKRPYGYSSFSYEISKFLKAGKNSIAVKVDNAAQPDSRWYSGSGIYRNVWLTSAAAVSIKRNGVFVKTTVISGDKGQSIENRILSAGESLASIAVDIELENKFKAKGNYKILTTIFDNKGLKIAQRQWPMSVDQNNSKLVTNALDIANPKLWSVERPIMYKLVTAIMQADGKIIDSYTTPFGIRDFNFDAQKGFSLNGKAMKILGVCLHHDLGALGAAVNVRAMERQLEIMKAMGVNAIRTAHNPPAPEFLDLCDKMGFLVMDEAFDMWVKKKTKNDYHLNFPEWHKSDLEEMIKRDRNHPSIILWSIGNEIREQFDSTGVAITKELVGIVKNLDKTRPVISALTETKAEKNFIYQANVLDIYGLNYNHKLYKDFPENYPGVKFLATETTSALATRGFYDTADTIRRWPKDGKTKFTEGNKEWSASAYDNVSAYWGSTHEETWAAAKKYDHVSGLFVWTGFDYLGEPLPYPWPARSSYFGIVDLAGFPKDSYYMYQSEWTNKPVLHILPHWNWRQGKLVEVWAYYNNADEVELYLNGKSLGKRSKQGDDLHVLWNVPFEPGTLKAISRKSGKDVLVREVKTAGEPAKIELIADRKNIKADGKDLSFVTVRILDAAGNVVPDADNLVDFKLDGVGFIAGVDNGFQASLEPFKANYRKAFHGLCLAIVQSTEKTGTIKLTASSAGLMSSSIIINNGK
ncbi:glycoside hydrolase family 2 TIM barrel-domain containing protein [Pedobacter sp. D749]|uniref:glycoside hydrolase family 2 TIM barrel-domain containing protein n=1 Tax=Pedobacter sp. D749 TaxID=2856523 RepID=UPI002104FBA6|nr:glycoside hydrolase family 2 TIM barrel-domain containing protein [Pedobacter sp. D749]